jgi:hypothetical protein
MVEATAQTLIEQYKQITPAEAVDYTAVIIEEYTQDEWARERGLEGHQSIGQNVRNARKKINRQAEPREIIQQVVVDPDDVIEALRYNARDQYNRNGSADLKIDTPFYVVDEAPINYESDSGDYPAGMSPKPIHISPTVFIGEKVRKQPNRNDVRAAVKDEMKNPTEEDLKMAVEQAFDEWESEIIQYLPDETDINNSKYEHGSPHVVSVRYD